MLRMFDFECGCGYKAERIVAGDEKLSCPDCGEELRRLPPRVNVNMGPVPITGYYDDQLETFIRTKNHRKEVMEQKGVVERGATPKGRCLSEPDGRDLTPGAY
jgi:hypothetical protein